MSFSTRYNILTIPSVALTLNCRYFSLFNLFVSVKTTFLVSGPYGHHTENVANQEPMLCAVGMHSAKLGNHLKESCFLSNPIPEEKISLVTLRAFMKYDPSKQLDAKNF